MIPLNLIKGKTEKKRHGDGGKERDHSFSFSSPWHMSVSGVCIGFSTVAANKTLSDVHSLVYLYQLVSLNVAVNSYDNALLTLLVSNQFVEIKGSVFKKFEKENLFQIMCAGKLVASPSR